MEIWFQLSLRISWIWYPHTGNPVPHIQRVIHTPWAQKTRIRFRAQNETFQRGIRNCIVLIMRQKTVIDGLRNTFSTLFCRAWQYLCNMYIILYLEASRVGHLLDKLVLESLEELFHLPHPQFELRVLPLQCFSLLYQAGLKKMQDCYDSMSQYWSWVWQALPCSRFM